MTFCQSSNHLHHILFPSCFCTNLPANKSNQAPKRFYSYRRKVQKTSGSPAGQLLTLGASGGSQMPRRPQGTRRGTPAPHKTTLFSLIDKTEVSDQLHEWSPGLSNASVSKALGRSGTKQGPPPTWARPGPAPCCHATSRSLGGWSFRIQAAAGQVHSSPCSPGRTKEAWVLEASSPSLCPPG